MTSHLIDPQMLRESAFELFMQNRQQRLLTLIESATGQSVYRGETPEEGEDAETDEETAEAKLTMAAA